MNINYQYKKICTLVNFIPQQCGKLPNILKGIIIGLILFDGHIALSNKGKNSYLIFNIFLDKLGYVYCFNYLFYYYFSYLKLNIGNKVGINIKHKS